MHLVLLDNRDSFVWNIVHLARSQGAEVTLLAAETATLADFERLKPAAIIAGPGPGHPAKALLSQELFAAFPSLPILGICLGHQALGLHHGAQITGSATLAHGRPVEIDHGKSGLFQGTPNPCHGGRYHSLCLADADFPSSLTVTARDACGEILAIRAREQPHVGIQFHPESLLADCGAQLMANFLTGAF